MRIYDVFYSKLPNVESELLPKGKAKFITFLNPYSIEKFSDRTELYSRFDYICSDGIFPILLHKIWRIKKSKRISFDMGSLAPVVFQWLVDNDKTVYFLGTTEENLRNFEKVITKNYSTLRIIGSHHGFIKGQEEEVVREIVSLNPCVVVIGMGAPFQDTFAMRLKDSGFQGTAYTCGGFMHQSSERLNYYPKWVNRWNLRTFYRFTREWYTWKRALKYPRFFIKYSIFLLNTKFKTK